MQTLPDDRLTPLTILDLPVADLYGPHWSLTGHDPPDGDSPDEAVYLPGRNILLLAKAGVFATTRGCRGIVMGPLASNPFPDGTRSFFDTMSSALGEGMGLSSTLPIETPLADLTKSEVVRRGNEWRIDLTFSCLRPTLDHHHCGACNKCGERQRGFIEADVLDPTRYGSGDELHTD